MLRMNRKTHVSDAPSPTIVAPTPTPTVEVTLPEGCPTDPQPLTGSPVSLTLLDHDNRTLPMLSLGLDESGQAAAAPPGNEPETVGWYNEGPVVGSDMGKVLLTAHTYQHGGAIGNDLNNGLLSPGDVIKITDDTGASACYSYSSSLHVLVEEYDENSNIIYDYSGAPMLAIVVCSDYTPLGDARGRMIYYADLLKA